MKRFILTTSIAALMAAPAAWAQENDAEMQSGATNGETEMQTPSNEEGVKIRLDQWAYDDLYESGLSYDRLVANAEVIGRSGEEIGSVENVILDDSGKVLALIAEVGGFWDIGDTHVSVPWSEVELSDDGNQVTIPVTEDNVNEYSEAGEGALFFRQDASGTQVVDDDLVTGMRVWKASDLVGDYAYLTGDERYGYVTDLIIGDDGQLDSVVVESRFTGAPGGYYAYPYSGYGTTGANYRYDMPYERDEIATLEEFDYDELRRGRGVGTTASVGTDDGMNGEAVEDDAEAMVEEGAEEIEEGADSMSE